MVYRETRSTNDLVFKAAGDGAAEGFCVLAESQTHGKGRKGRVWQSAQNKGLWFSLLLRPDWPLAHAAHLTYLASVALCRAIKKSARLNCQIKWPNDVLIDNRKVAGILTEIHGSGSRLDFAVLGVGCNILHDSADFPPELRDKVTSLKMSGANHDLRRADLLVPLLAELEMLYSRPWPEIYEQWKTLCLTIGKPVEVQTERGIVSGQMVGLEENGHLLLRLPSGKIEIIHSGDVLW
jgi:BirA family biotin operon repressor/biotin-[acetyl-CoA-carboxylase] ligase